MSWQVVTLSEACELITDGSHYTPKFQDQGYPFVTITQIRGERLDLESANRISEEEFAKLARGNCRPSPGDVLFSKDGTVGKVVHVDVDDPFIILSSLALLRPNRDLLNPRYLEWVLRAPGSLKQATARKTGVALTRVTLRNLRTVEIPIAPPEQQIAIVDYLDTQFSRLADAEDSLRRAKQNLERYRRSVLHAACTGRLVPTEAALAKAEGREYESASALLERILKERRAKWEEAEIEKARAKGKSPPKGWKKRYKEPVAPDVAGLPELPEGWCWTNLGQVIVEGPQNGVYYPASIYAESGRPILRIADFQVGWIRGVGQWRCIRDEAVDSRYELSQGDLIINRVNSLDQLGKSMVVPTNAEGCLFESNMMRMRISVRIHPTFLSRYLGTTEGRGRLISKAKAAVNQASINQADVAACPVPLAPAAEQERIARQLELRLDEASRGISSLAQASGRIALLRQSLLQSVFGSPNHV